MTQNDRAPSPSGISSFKVFLITLLPYLLFLAAFVPIIFLGKLELDKESTLQALSRSELEMKKLTVLFNYRLNFLREELAVLFKEHMSLLNLAKEADREKILFSRKAYLSFFSVAVATEKGLQTQRYYFHQQKSRPQSDGILNEVLSYLKANGLKIQKEPYWLHRLSDKTILVLFPDPDAWSSGGKPEKTDEGYRVLGAFDSEYFFSFCRFLTTPEAKHPNDYTSRSFILDGSGNVLCHSNSTYQNKNFSSYEFFKKISFASNPNGTVEYDNITGTPVTAWVKKISFMAENGQSESYFLVSEAQSLPYFEQAYAVLMQNKNYLITAVALLLTSLLLWLLTGYFVSLYSRRVVRSWLGLDIGRKQDLTRLDSDEVKQFSKELKELQEALLDLQGQEAFRVGFQAKLLQIESENTTGSDNSFTHLHQEFADYIATLQLSVFWFPVKNNTISPKYIYFAGPAFETSQEFYFTQLNDLLSHTYPSPLEKSVETDLCHQLADFLTKLPGNSTPKRMMNLHVAAHQKLDSEILGYLFIGLDELSESEDNIPIHVKEKNIQERLKPLLQIWGYFLKAHMWEV